MTYVLSTGIKQYLCDTLHLILILLKSDGISPTIQKCNMRTQHFIEIRIRVEAPAIRKRRFGARAQILLLSGRRGLC